MTKNELTIYTELIEKKPSKHTDKLHSIIILGIHTGYSYCKKRSYTYYTCKTKEGTYYPAANSTDRQFLCLDGLVGTYDLSKLKKEYTIVK